MNNNNLLYKYRRIISFESFADTLINNCLYAAQYKDVNHPTEGRYYYNKGELDKTNEEN